MTPFKAFFGNILLMVYIFIPCSATISITDINLVGSTPANSLIKSMLSIPAQTKVDFIKWNLDFKNDNSFNLNIIYGESQPNTLGFIGGGENRTIHGTFSIEKNNHFKEVYRLKSNDFSSEILLAKLNENIFHLLTTQNQMMVGNGGWSYALNRKVPVNSNEILISSVVSDSKTLQQIFHGRTPCQEIANEHPEMKVSQACFKLKWRLILNRDSVNYQPTTYTIRKVIDGKARDITGNWTIIRGIPNNPDALIYKIGIEKPEDAISFLVADDNVLLFLNKDNVPFIGNKDFNFVLDKRID